VLNKVTLGTGRMRFQISRNGLMAKLGVTTGSLDSRNETRAFEIPYKLRNRGRQLKILPELTANQLVRLKNLPIDWPSQRDTLSFPVA